MPIIIPIIVFIVSGVGVTYMISKKVPLLRSLDSSVLAAEVNLEVKKSLLEERMKRQLKMRFEFVQVLFKPLGQKLGEWLKKLYSLVVHKEREYEAKMRQVEYEEYSDNEKNKVIEDQLEIARDKETEEDAESKYLEVLSLDSKNTEAYEGLVEIFMKRKEYDHAREIYEHLLRLGSSKIEYFLNLTEIWLSQDFIQRGFRVMQGALKIHPKNPKLLDKLIEVAILLEDAMLARDYIRRLKEINPDNKKLIDFSKQVEDL